MSVQLYKSNIHTNKNTHIIHTSNKSNNGERFLLYDGFFLFKVKVNVLLWRNPYGNGQPFLTYETAFILSLKFKLNILKIDRSQLGFIKLQSVTCAVTFM